MKKNVFYLIMAILLFAITSTNSDALYLRLASDNIDDGDDKIQFGIYDELGRYTGYDFSKGTNGGVIRNSPDFLYGSGGVDSFGEGAIVNYLDGNSNSSQGTYKLLIYGQRLSIYKLTGVMRDVLIDDTGMIGKLVITGLIDVGQIKYIEIKYTPNNPVVTRIATSQDLIADIITAQKLNLIGNTKFVSELTKDITKIEAEKAKGKIDDGLTPAQKAKKEYTELLKEITEKYNKPEADEFVRQEAYTVLKEDLEYIISHLQ